VRSRPCWSGRGLAARSPLGSRAGARFAVNRTTPSLLFHVNPSPKRFDRLPGGWDLSGSLTADHPRIGALRMIVLAQRDHVGVELERDAYIGFLHSGTRHELLTTRWEQWFGRWQAAASAGQDTYTKATDIGVLAVDEDERHRSARAQLIGAVAGWRVQAGGDLDAVETAVNGSVPTRGGDFGGVSGSSDFVISHRDWRAGGFAVVSRAFGRFTPEVSARVDRFDAAGAVTGDPRAALRVEIARGQALRVAAGRYHQAPSSSYFDDRRGAAMLLPMSATHEVIGYEAGALDAPLFARVEIYRKNYRDLPVQDDELGFSSQGYGSATGADVFVRRLWPRVDVKVSASLLDAERRWTSVDQRDRYPLPAGTWTPDFAIPYSFQAVTNVTLTRALGLGASWRTAAGKPFTPAIGAIATGTAYEPVWGEINSGRLPRYERLDLSISLIAPFGARGSAVFFASLDNALGRDNAFDVAYSADYGVRRLITTASPRSFYIGCAVTR